jgi:hypothetical protein
LLDNLDFTGNLLNRAEFHQDPGGGGAVLSVGPFTFESLVDWSSSEAALLSDPADKSQGTASLAFEALPWVALESRELLPSELSGVTDRFSVDVQVPELPGTPDWVGQLLVYFSCPSAGLFNQFAGERPLYPAFDEEFAAVEITLPLVVRAALASGPSDCTVRLGFALNDHLGVFRVDNGGFVQP